MLLEEVSRPNKAPNANKSPENTDELLKRRAKYSGLDPGYRQVPQLLNPQQNYQYEHAYVTY